MRKLLLSLTLLFVAFPAFAGDAVIFSGNFVKTLKDDILLYDTARIITGTADPTAVATLGEKGSLYLRQTVASDGEAYIKRDTGTTTNWDLIQTSASTILTPSRAVVTDASGYLAASATTATQIGLLSSAAGTTGTTSTNIVFSTSPVLTTPNLGTPSALVLTNATGTPSSIGLANGTGLPLTTGVTGTLPVGNGGSGAATFTAHGVLVGNAASPFSVTAAGTTGQVLTGSTGADPVWAAPATAGTVTSVNGSGGTTGLTLTGGPITSSGTLTLGGTLAVANGGTGVTSSTGSTNVVLSTSPVLVTPNLGTPSTLVLTNATGTPTSIGLANGTGLPLTTGVTGVLGAANGGTGIANNAAATLTWSGNNATTLTTTGTTSLTLPTSGTLATNATATSSVAGLTTSWAPIVQSGVTTSSADITVATGDGFNTILMTHTTSTKTVTLPSAASSTGRSITIKQVGSGGATDIVVTAGALIDGLSTQTLNYQYDAMTFVTDGSLWYVASYSPGYYSVSTAVGTSGDFTGGTFRCERHGFLIVIYFSVLTHGSSTHPVSASGLVPSACRPPSDVRTAYIAATAQGFWFRVASDGTVDFNYGGAARTDTADTVSISFLRST